MPAGTWRLVGDGIIAGDLATQMEVQLSVLLRKKDGPAGSGQVVVQWVNRYVRDPQRRFAAIPFSGSAPGAAVAAEAGDLLVLRILPVGGDPSASFIPNGDGGATGGQIPRIDLPR